MHTVMNCPFTGLLYKNRYRVYMAYTVRRLISNFWIIVLSTPEVFSVFVILKCSCAFFLSLLFSFVVHHFLFFCGIQRLRHFILFCKLHKCQTLARKISSHFITSHSLHIRSCCGCRSFTWTSTITAQTMVAVPLCGWDLGSLWDKGVRWIALAVGTSHLSTHVTRLTLIQLLSHLSCFSSHHGTSLHTFQGLVFLKN